VAALATAPGACRPMLSLLDVLGEVMHSLLERLGELRERHD
jgi:hypothetical protein